MKLYGIGYLTNKLPTMCLCYKNKQTKQWQHFHSISLIVFLFHHQLKEKTQEIQEESKEYSQFIDKKREKRWVYIKLFHFIENYN